MSVLSLIYRTVGPWGAGKGANLTAAEVDSNFADISDAIDALSANPAEANGIDTITTDETGTQLTFHMDDGSTQGPFTMPTATFKNRGAWTPSTAYAANDLFTATDPDTLDGFLYFVNRPFNSGLGFVPTLGAGVGGADPYATPLVPMPSKVRVALFYPGKPGVGLPELGSAESFAPMFSYLTVDPWFVRTVDTASIARLRHAPQFNTSYELFRETTSIGTVAFLAGQKIGTVTITADTNFASGDLLEVAAPSGIDPTAAGLALTIVGALGALDLDSSS